MINRHHLLLAIAVAMVCTVQAAPVNESAARQIADKFLNARNTRLMAPHGQSVTRLAYVAEREHFYVYDRGGCDGFVIVAGDDRLPPVLGYGDAGDFSASTLPPAVQYWMDEMNRQIAYLQAHGGVAAHRPVKRLDPVGPLLTTKWDQVSPYNDLCPVGHDSDGNAVHAVTGCVATSTAQVMNYHQWPPVGRGSHSYVCNFPPSPMLSADFSQSFYRWDLMLDEYDENSSAESCEAVAKLMSDVGISVEMEYGDRASGALSSSAAHALINYFGYSNKCYWLHRDNYPAAEWDQFLVDEISARRPILYTGHCNGGHAFVIDGFDSDGFFHVNWGWRGRYDGYFLISLLAPKANLNYDFNQYGLFGLVPETQAETIDNVLNIRGLFWSDHSSVPLGNPVNLKLRTIAEGNLIQDTVGPDYAYYYAYGRIPLALALYDSDGVECKSVMTSLEYIQNPNLVTRWTDADIAFDLPRSLEDGEYVLKPSYSVDNGVSYGYPLLDYYGGQEELYAKVIVSNDTAYFKNSLLSAYFGVESFTVPRGVKINDSFDVGVNISYGTVGADQGELEDGLAGNVYLALLRDGVEVASSEMCEVMVPRNSVRTCHMQLEAPSEPGLYDLVLKDESGNQLLTGRTQFGHDGPATSLVYILPACQELVEGFESMAANSSTSDKNVQGVFTTWSFIRCGVRSPGEGRRNGIHSVLLKKGSGLYTSSPLSHGFFMAQAVFFNPSLKDAKYVLEYSFDSCATWETATTVDGLLAAEVPANRVVAPMWKLDLTAAQPATFRIVMTDGGTGATYVDDISLYYIDLAGDVNGDSEINIGDVNALLDLILNDDMIPAADVNGDGEVNIADVNALIALILSKR